MLQTKFSTIGGSLQGMLNFIPSQDIGRFQTLFRESLKSTIPKIPLLWKALYFLF